MKELEKGNVNILYLTTNCNIACTYCYEDLQKKEKVRAKFEELKKQVDTIIENEPDDVQTLFVLFGGEPTLEWDTLKQTVEYAYSKKKNVFFNLETNGIKMDDDEFFMDFVNFFKDKPHSIDISFDGIGNVLRVDHQGNDTTEKLLRVLYKFSNYKDPLNWRIRYTITKANLHSFGTDIINIINEFNPKRVITGEDNMSFTKEDQEVINKQKFALDYLWNTGKITTPICSIFCETCDGCSMQKSSKRYVKNGEVVEDISVNDNQGLFDHFKEKER